MEQYSFVEMHCLFAEFCSLLKKKKKKSHLFQFHRTKLIKTAQGLILLLSKRTYIYLRVLSSGTNKLKWLSEKIKTTDMTKT